MIELLLDNPNVRTRGRYRASNLSRDALTGRHARSYSPKAEKESFSGYIGRHSKNGNADQITADTTELVSLQEPAVYDIAPTKNRGRHRSGTWPMLLGASIGTKIGSSMDLSGDLELGLTVPEAAETAGTTSIGAMVGATVLGAFYELSRGGANTVHDSSTQPGTFGFRWTEA